MEINVDMDGVLANFHHHALTVLYAKGLTNFNPSHGWPSGVDWVIDICEPGFTEDDFWAVLPEDFFLQLPLMEDFDQIIKIVERFDKNWQIASSPGRRANAATQKIDWMRNYIDKDFDRYMLGKHKDRLASHKSVLIDDWEKQTVPFAKAGGFAILLPRPWNSRHAESHLAMEILEETLETIEDHLNCKGYM